MTHSEVIPCSAVQCAACSHSPEMHRGCSAQSAVQILQRPCSVPDLIVWHDVAQRDLHIRLHGEWRPSPCMWVLPISGVQWQAPADGRAANVPRISERLAHRLLAAAQLDAVALKRCIQAVATGHCLRKHLESYPRVRFFFSMCMMQPAAPKQRCHQKLSTQTAVASEACAGAGKGGYGWGRSNDSPHLHLRHGLAPVCLHVPEVQPPAVEVRVHLVT